jgi:hypothetical protein
LPGAAYLFLGKDSAGRKVEKGQKVNDQGDGDHNNTGYEVSDNSFLKSFFPGLQHETNLKKKPKSSA